MTALRPAPPAAAFDPVERGLGVLIPVVGAHGGAGASGVAVALADALDAQGLRVLLVDGADPARSGLADVWTQQLRSEHPGRSGAVVNTARRRGIIGRRSNGVDAQGRVRAYPYLDEWASAELLSDHGPFDVTVVDVGWDPWLALAHVASGPLAWLTARPDAAFGVLVARPTRPSMRLATGVAARWLHLTSSGPARVTPHLVVTDAAVIDTDLRSHAGSALLPLLDSAAAMPPDPAGRTSGWTAEPTPTATSRAAQRVLVNLPDPVGGRFKAPATARPSRFTRRTPKEN